VNAIDTFEPGSTLFVATSEQYPVMIPETAEQRAAWSPSLKHVGSYAVLGSPVFVPMIWAEPTQQPLNVKPAYFAPYAYQGNSPRKLYDAAALSQFISEIEKNLQNESWRGLSTVYVLVVRSKGTDLGPIPPEAERVSEGERFVVLRVKAGGKS
jgi:hypothetical protein